LREIGGLEKLVDFLADSEQKHMHINCLNVLSNCLEDTQCLDLIQQSGGLTKILAYCQDINDDIDMSQVNAAAAKALARSARKDENRKILSEQLAEKMLIYLLLSDSDETKASAAFALSVMAESRYSQDVIRNYGNN
jgi:armadillo repeat-containing protein 3